MCDDGFIKINGVCTEDDSDGGSNADSNSGSGSDDNSGSDSDFGSGSTEVCDDGERLVLGVCVTDSGYGQSTTQIEQASDTAGGCSLIASQSAGNWAQFVLIIPALLGLGLFRSLRRRHRRQTRS